MMASFRYGLQISPCAKHYTAMRFEENDAAQRL